MERAEIDSEGVWHVVEPLEFGCEASRQMQGAGTWNEMESAQGRGGLKQKIDSRDHDDEERCDECEWQ